MITIPPTNGHVPTPDRSAGDSDAHSTAGVPRSDGEAHQSRYVVTIDRDLCIGAATCVDLAPKTLALDGENKAIVLGGPWDDDATILASAKSCPTLAVIVRDRETGVQVFPV